MKASKEHYIIIGRGEVSEYALRAIVALRGLAEEEVLVLKGRGEGISKAVDVYNEVRSRIGEALQLVNVSIGSERAGRKKLPFIEIRIKMTV